MMRHLSANLWLLGLTLLICAVVYPLALFCFGQVVFPWKANGSLLAKDEAESAFVGSALIAQPFASEEYFQARPSAVSYNAAATGGSNWGANNPALRARVLGQLGSILKYGPKGAKPGKRVGPDIERWFQSDQSGMVDRWAQRNPDRAKALQDAEPKAKDLTELMKTKTAKEIQDTFYVMWREEHPNEDLEPVPADMVTTSGSGLDPHITLKNALYQMERVAAAWTERTKATREEVDREIRKLLDDMTEAPLHGLVGAELVNVLNVNRALPQRMQRLSRVARIS